MENKPYKAVVRSYQVGFGDCFLLTFSYKKKAGQPDEEKNILIDCGSTAPPLAFARIKKAFSLDPVAAEIKKQCNGKLTAVVATHRHKDHISGFATSKNGKASGDIIRDLKPELVLQPWTEDPELATDARKGTTSLRARNGSSRRFAIALQGMHQFSAGLLTELNALRGSLSIKLQEQLSFLGDDNSANLSAVKNLMSMGENEYLCYGQKTKLEKLLPGVRIKVLGPPTLEQNERIAKQRSKDAAEFWHLRGAAARSFVSDPISPFSQEYRVNQNDFPPEVRWIIPRVQASRGAQLLELVRILDDQMNNTSLILSFQAGGKTLLFPGDAQIENWSHALFFADDKDKNLELLSGTDFYKVGHHGSLNATPKTLWGLFKKKADGQQPATLQTMMSTRRGKHGDTARNSEVPRIPLLEELGTKSLLFNTEDLKGTDVVCHTAAIDF